MMIPVYQKSLKSDHIPITVPPEELTTIVDYYNTFPYQFLVETGFPKFRIVQKDGNYVLEKEYECCESLRTIDPDNNYLLLTSEYGTGFTHYHFKLLGRKSRAPVVLINNVSHQVYQFPDSVLKLFKLIPDGWIEEELILPE